jgi:hypothetical protein
MVRPRRSSKAVSAERQAPVLDASVGKPAEGVEIRLQLFQMNDGDTGSFIPVARR